MPATDLDRNISQKNRREGMMPSEILIYHLARHCRISQGLIQEAIKVTGPSPTDTFVTFDRCLEALRRIGLVAF